MIWPNWSTFLKFTAVSSEAKSKLSFPVVFFPKTYYPPSKSISYKNSSFFPPGHHIEPWTLSFWNMVKLLFLFLIFSHIYVCTDCVWAGSHAHMCACVSKAFGWYQVSSLMAFYLVFWNRISPWTQSSSTLASHLVGKCHLHSQKKCWDYMQGISTCTWPYVVSGDLDSVSWFLSKYFICRAISVLMLPNFIDCKSLRRWKLKEHSYCTFLSP